MCPKDYKFIDIRSKKPFFVKDNPINKDYKIDKSVIFHEKDEIKIMTFYDNNDTIPKIIKNKKTNLNISTIDILNEKVTNIQK
ncbi:hypothetical protein KHQ81_10955 [Mycoplasmatota bacterium]|nr:hypothetical protein KHQ81_10955 [Mycoplasmatota bacterium]